MKPHGRILLAFVLAAVFAMGGAQALYADIVTIKAVEGDVPSPINPPPGCHFAPRCPFATEKCHAHYPPAVQTEEGHTVACWLHTEEGT